MKRLFSEPKRYGAELALAAGMLLAMAYLLMRNRGLFPGVFADEWIYSRAARLLPLNESMLPSYLYLALFRTTNACGAGFLGCARLFNVLFVVGAAPFFYSSARTVAGKGAAAVVVMLALLAPFNLYTVYFMPEAMYYFGFSVLSWVALTRQHWSMPLYAAALGALLGLMMLVKVHALFLLPAIWVYLAWLAWSRRARGRWLVDLLAALVAVTLTMFAVRFGVGFALVGKAGLGLFGNFYGSQAGNMLNAGATLLKLMPGTWASLRGHLMSLLLLFALPLALLLQFAFGGAARAQLPTAGRSLQVYAILLLGAPLLMAAGYTASIADFGPDEALRLHLRYYDFAFPLLLMVVAGALGGRHSSASRVSSGVIAAALAAGLVYALAHLGAFKLSYVDGPEITALTQDLPWFHLLVGLELLTLAAWVWRPRWAAALCLFGFAPLYAWHADDELRQLLKQSAIPTMYESAGIFARGVVPPEQRKDLSMAGSGLVEMMRTQFQIDNPEAGVIQLAPGAPVDLTHVPANRGWLLVVGEHALPPGLQVAASRPDAVLVRLTPGYRRIGAAKFGVGGDTSLLAAVDGMAPAEFWGRWSIGERVVLRFQAALPEHVSITLRGLAYGPNASAPFIARVGKAEQRFMMTASEQEIFLRFDTDGSQRELVIEVPHPTVPPGVGAAAADTRRLGIGLMAMEVGTTPPASR